MALFFYQFTPLYGHNLFVRKMRFVYGQIIKNEDFVRKPSAQKMPFTDKMVKNGRLSVRFQPFRTRFYGQMAQKAGFVRKSSS